MPVIPAAWEVQVEGFMPRISYLKNNQSKKSKQNKTRKTKLQYAKNK
jgi:hypothetical protein